MEQDKGASSSEDRATAAEPVVSALRDGIPSAEEIERVASGIEHLICCLPSHSSAEKAMRWAQNDLRPTCRIIASAAIGALRNNKAE